MVLAPVVSGMITREADIGYQRGSQAMQMKGRKDEGMHGIRIRW
jgi:hypothetical protein